MRGKRGWATVLLVALSFLGAEASDARRAVEAFVGRIADVRITDLTIHQTLTVFHPDGRRPQSTAGSTSRIGMRPITLVTLPSGVEFMPAWVPIFASRRRVGDEG